jgi:hypothetical protein
MSCICDCCSMTGGVTMSERASKTASRLSGGVCDRYGAKRLWSETAASSQLASTRTLTASGDEVRNLSQAHASAGCFVFADATTAFAKKWCALRTFPGSTDTSHAKGASFRLGNSQMPVCHMASLPDLNRAES